MVEPAPSLYRVTNLVYALHSLSIVIGLVTAAAVITAFVFGWPSIIAVIINYVKRDEARGTYLESHFRWQIRTFWFGLPLVCDRRGGLHHPRGYSGRARPLARRRALGDLPDRPRVAGTPGPEAGPLALGTARSFEPGAFRIAG